MAEKISHAGIVELVEPGHLAVRIMQTSACAACGAKKICRSSESKEKIIDVYTSDALAYRAGQAVMVTGSASFGMKAVRLAFLYPLVLLFVAFIICFRVSGGNEALSGLVALAAMLPWYVILWCFRTRLQTAFTFDVETDESGISGISATSGDTDSFSESNQVT